MRQMLIEHGVSDIRMPRRGTQYINLTVTFLDLYHPKETLLNGILKENIFVPTAHLCNFDLVNTNNFSRLKTQ